MNYRSGRVGAVDSAEFADLLGRPLPQQSWPQRPLTRDDIIAQTKGRGGFASLLHTLIIGASRMFLLLGRPHAANNVRFVLDLPFRSIARMSGGRVSAAMVDGLLVMVNGRFWRGARRTVSAWWAHRSCRNGGAAHAPGE